MVKKRCLIAVMGEHGHVNPALAIARQLVSQGIKVAVFAPGPFQPAVLAANAEFLLYSSIFAASRRPLKSAGEHLVDFPTRLVEECRHVLPQLVEATRSWRPDLVAYDKMLLAGGYAARKLGLPAAMLCPTYAENSSFSVIGARGLQAEASPPFSRAAALLAAEWDTQPFTPESLFFRAEPLNVVFLPRPFQPNEAAFDEKYEFVGPCLSHETSLAAETVPPSKTIFLSLGTVFNAWPEFFQMCIEALAHTHWQVIMAVGGNVDGLGSLPPNVTVQAHAPQLEILSRSALFITHGGMNSAMEALYHGVPMIVVPQMPEQEVTAERIAELGLGVALAKREVSVDTLRSAVDRVICDAKIKASVSAMQKSVRAAGGARRAADLLVGYGLH